ncbi:hypothetical protein [Desulfuromonas sp. TF]|uniref:hypothetical protein n=1 Tax=Desulfuromonas sp. TF TaxID=1232410 RepID=UPI0003F6ED67|nr:hypothetical protein [Desulfuromonas sp. TF]
MENEPSQIIAGDAISWKRSLPDYPASAGWSLSYALRGPKQIDIATAADDDDHLVDVDSGTSASWLAGVYRMFLQVAKDGKRYTIDQVELEILPDPTHIADGTDLRPHVKKVLDAIEAVLEGKATRDQLAYTIDGVRIDRIPPLDLLEWRRRYRVEWNNHLKSEGRKKGRRSGNKIRVSF